MSLTLVEQDALIDAKLLEEFKIDVKNWLQLDDGVKQLQREIKEQKKVHKELGDKISNFMANNNVEDLNTKNGVIRYTKSLVKAPLSQKAIKEKLTEAFQGNDSLNTILTDVFDNREKLEKFTLKRINFGGN
jgi:seryl-tRNA synthetase